MYYILKQNCFPLEPNLSQRDLRSSSNNPGGTTHDYAQQPRTKLPKQLSFNTPLFVEG